MIRKLFALLKRDFLIEASYKVAFLANLLSVFAAILTYYFIDKLFGHRITDHLGEFGVSYFSYVLLSMALFSYIGVGLGSFSSRIRSEQVQGTLESIFVTPTGFITIIIGMGLWNLFIATFDVLVYFICGKFLFNINLGNFNPMSAAVLMILSILSFSSLGIISASFTLVFKRGNPVTWVINTLEGLLGGVYFPIAVMPVFLQKIAYCLPITYAIRGMQLAVYKGYGLNQLKLECSVLFGFTLILMPLSIFVFKSALKVTRRQGSLGKF